MHEDKMPTLRILIADDHEIVRQGLRSLIESRPGWEVCGEAADGWEAVSKAAELHPDIAALDVGMPNLNGLDAARQILRNEPRQKVLFLTIYESEQLARSVAAMGAKGLILKSDAGKDLLHAIDALQHNGTFFNARMAQALGSDLRGNHRAHDKDVLTRRERQVVQLLAEGKSTKEVATVLDLSVKTAETHRSNIMSKLGLHSVSELVLYAVRNNIVQALNPESLAGPAAPGTESTGPTLPK
ncbi:MAG: response regulator transcription factor [Acidobacteria bacterium]|nr:response regulator transcription factor [Acidobacteriota bacterium]MBV9482758.1 response regulator transcription factor [Acidobacteriota bacterium]